MSNHKPDLAAVKLRFNDAKSARDRGALTTDQLATAWVSAEDVPTLLAEVDRLTEHSVTLNRIMYAMAVALGRVVAPHSFDGNVDELLAALLDDRDQLRKQVAALTAAGEDLCCPDCFTAFDLSQLVAHDAEQRPETGGSARG